jgi:hypothetical protein
MPPNAKAGIDQFPNEGMNIDVGGLNFLPVGKRVEDFAAPANSPPVSEGDSDRGLPCGYPGDAATGLRLGSCGP